jgi:hypothetical protein
MQIGPVSFSITEDKTEYLEYSKNNEPHNAYGYMDYCSQRIILDKKQGPDNKADTLLHEIMHVIFTQVGGKEAFDDDDEEKIIIMFSTGLLDVMRRNKHVVEYLMGEEWSDS